MKFILGKDYSNDFEKLLRDKVENLVANYLGVENKWRKGEYAYCQRLNNYGYGEFHTDYCYVLANVEPKNEEGIEVFDVKYKCACGCGEEISPSDEDFNEDRYDGLGFKHDCMSSKGTYCEYCDDYCDVDECCAENCAGCSTWDENHPVCSLDNEECEDPGDEYWDSNRSGNIQADYENCHNCPRWQECHPDEEDEEEDE